MERIRALNRYQKGVLVVLAAMMLVFTILYPVVTSRTGFAYKDTVLVQGQEEGNTVYTGKVYGIPSRFTVTPDKTVVFQYGKETYGPYAVREDPTAAPKGVDTSGHMTGIELRRGDEVIFRGGVVEQGENRWIYNEDGSIESAVGIDIGISVDGTGDVIDPMGPSVSTIVNLVAGPKLTHPGDWWGWWAGVFCCVVTVVSMLFADELFRFQLALSIRNVEDAEPSDWEMMGRYATWTVFPILALLAFIIGLQ